MIIIIITIAIITTIIITTITTVTIICTTMTSEQKLSLPTNQRDDRLHRVLTCLTHHISRCGLFVNLKRANNHIQLTISRCLLLMIRKRWREAAMGVPYVRRRWQWNHWPKWNESVRWLWWSRLHDDDGDWWLISILYLSYIQGGWGRVQDAWVRWWRKSRGNLYKDGQVIIKSTTTIIIWIDIGTTRKIVDPLLRRISVEYLCCNTVRLFMSFKFWLQGLRRCSDRR